MTLRDKITHLLRRFGLGATLKATHDMETAGLEAAISQLIDYEKTDEEFPFTPWEFAFDKEGNLNLEAPRFAAWWCMRMLMTKRPLQEKLTLFWHDHFAVGAQKVELGPVMLEYMQILRTHAAGNFAKLLTEVSKSTAMLWWLDTNTSFKYNPNENFARELLELFTLGKGYTEKDIKECARAFTGWSFIPTFADPNKGPADKQIKEHVMNDVPLTLHIIIPALHDDGEKTVLNRTGNFDGDDVLKITLEHPETARNIITKLWEWFAYPNPEPSIVQRLASVFEKSGYEIKPVLRSIAESNEFWSEKCVRQKVKSPVDFTIAIMRQLELDPILQTFRDKDAKKNTPIRDEISGASFFMGFSMSNQGLQLLYPPDVGGWKWGEEWITSGAMIERMQTAETLFGKKGDVKPLTPWLALKLSENMLSKTPQSLVSTFLKLFDGKVDAQTEKAILECCISYGGPDALAKPETAAPLLGEMAKRLFAASSFQFC
jgi:uncharacterized protein (DUF1800 family)